MKNISNWTSEEDQALRILYFERKIKKWSKISKMLQSQFQIFDKNAKKCRQRYNNHVNPQINRSQWTKQQQNLLFVYQSQMGNKWAQIARKLSGRTDNFVKNKFYSKMRHAIRNINQLSYKHKQQNYKQITIKFIYKIMAVIDYKFRHQVNDIEEEAIQLAEKIRNNIILFNDFDVKQENQYHETLSKLSKDIQAINIYFKKKISMRKSKKLSKMVKDVEEDEEVEQNLKVFQPEKKFIKEQIQQSISLIDQKEEEEEEEDEQPLKKKQISNIIQQIEEENQIMKDSLINNEQCRINQQKIMIHPIAQVKQDELLYLELPQYILKNTTFQMDPWEIHYFEQNFGQ